MTVLLAACTAGSGARSSSPPGPEALQASGSASAPVREGAADVPYRRRLVEAMVRMEHEGVTWGVLERWYDEEWYLEDGMVRWRTTELDPTFPSAEDEARWRASGSDLVGPVAPGEVREGTVDPYDWPSLYGVDVSDLPVDQSELAHVVAGLVDGRCFCEKAQMEPSPEWEPDRSTKQWQLLVDLIGDPRTSEGTRRSAVALVASLPDTEDLGPVSDRNGRPGVALAHVDGGPPSPHNTILVLDETTGELLTEEYSNRETPASMLDSEWPAADTRSYVGWSVTMESDLARPPLAL